MILGTVQDVVPAKLENPSVAAESGIDPETYASEQLAVEVAVRRLVAGDLPPGHEAVVQVGLPGSAVVGLEEAREAAARTGEALWFLVDGNLVGDGYYVQGLTVIEQASGGFTDAFEPMNDDLLVGRSERTLEELADNLARAVQKGS